MVVALLIFMDSGFMPETLLLLSMVNTKVKIIYNISTLSIIIVISHLISSFGEYLNSMAAIPSVQKVVLIHLYHEAYLIISAFEAPAWRIVFTQLSSTHEPVLIPIDLDSHAVDPSKNDIIFYFLTNYA